MLLVTCRVGAWSDGRPQGRIEPCLAPTSAESKQLNEIAVSDRATFGGLTRLQREARSGAL
jgi:hypothetical protein